jgi:hypothetical protein
MLTATAVMSPVVQALYGIRIRTPWPIGGVAVRNDAWDVELVAGQQDALDRAAEYIADEQKPRWAQYAALPDGSAYRRWSNLFEFLVTADARRIYARAVSGVEDEAMLAYLLVDALSFSMVRLGFEPLHATAVLTDYGVIAFLGNSGDGKSTLAALLVQHGCKLLTDDMLVLARDRGRWLAQPGPPRLKLHRAMADHLLGSTRDRVGMNPDTTKMIVALDSCQCTTEAHALRAAYILSADVDAQPRAPLIQQLSPAAAFPRLLAHTAGHYPSEEARLRRQFDFATTIVREIPIKTLSYRRETTQMIELRDTVLADVARH